MNSLIRPFKRMVVYTQNKYGAQLIESAKAKLTHNSVSDCYIIAAFVYAQR